MPPRAARTLLFTGLLLTIGCDLDWVRFEPGGPGGDSGVDPDGSTPDAGGMDAGSSDASTSPDANRDAAVDSGLDSLAAGLVLHLPLNEGSGATTRELIVGNDAQLRNGASFVADGAAGSAVRFDGTDDDVLIPTTTPINLGQRLSVSLWLRVPSVTGGIFLSCSGDPRFAVKISDGDRGLQGVWGRINETNWPEFIVETAASETATDTWQHVVFTVEDGALRFYIDAEMVGEETRSAPVEVDPPVAFCHIGQNGADSSYFVGDIDEVRVYDRRLGDAEIDMLFEQRR